MPQPQIIAAVILSICFISLATPTSPQHHQPQHTQQWLSSHHHHHNGVVLHRKPHGVTPNRHHRPTQQLSKNNVVASTIPHTEQPSHHGPRPHPYHVGPHHEQPQKTTGHQGFNNTPTQVHPLFQEFLDAHNKVRLEYNLPLFTWDEKLESYARDWATNRYFDCAVKHSGKPGMYGDRPYGESIYWSYWPHSPARIVNSLFKEREDYDFNTNTCKPGKMCGHFTQIIWRDSRRLGCFRQKCHGNGGYIVVCEYDPKGNIYNAKPLEAHLQ
ncbi:Pathogenesis-related protein 1 [Quillaja saponaria]|uniref:Pathogenesis-related protein 1 n=1 Tax=Quillaja saponaria TaxID=32244 RepID=A0AAD7Q0A2_QUISA|nr:Pathogenesis-related protein 1 [Quillaja saponaria]